LTMPAPPPEDELPPPPSDIAEQTKHYPEIKVVKTGPVATLRRAITILEKDIRTMAKHGLVSSVILFVFLIIVFSIMSFSMKQAMSFDIGDMGGDGEDKSIPWATEQVPPNADAGDDMTVDAGTTVTLDGSGSTDNDRIVYYVWSIWENDRDVELYGEQVEYTFYAVGTYVARLTVVDYSINQDEDNVTITVNQRTSDTVQPMAMVPMNMNIMVGETVTFNGSGSTDDVAVVNWTWTFYDFMEHILYGENASYTFNYASHNEVWVSLTVRDYSGNTQMNGFSVTVSPSTPDTNWPYAQLDDIGLVVLGDTLTLDGSASTDDSGSIESYTWYIDHNGTYEMLTGQVVQYTPSEWGGYQVMLVVRDSAGNYNTAQTEIIVAPAGVDPNIIAWNSTPLGIDVSFNLLTYAYGVALLSSVIFVGGLFAKGFAHEIQKGTVKVLFFGPISVTTMIFSKILYPIVVAPFFIFPLVMFALATFEQDTAQIFTITLVAYLMAVLTMVAAAYGSCLIYFGAKRMVLKPSVVSRMFLYFSLLGTLTVFEWLSFVLDMWLKVDTYGNMYDSYSGGIAMFSPFHQGGIILSNMIMGTTQSPDWAMFAIPIALIVIGVAVSHKLYPDIFSRE